MIMRGIHDHGRHTLCKLEKDYLMSAWMECLADCHKRNLNMRESLLSNPVKKYRCILTSGLFTYTYIVTLRRVIMSDLDGTHSSYVARWRIKSIWSG